MPSETFLVGSGQVRRTTGTVMIELIKKEVSNTQMKLDNTSLIIAPALLKVLTVKIFWYKCTTKHYATALM